MPQPSPYKYRVVGSLYRSCLNVQYTCLMDDQNKVNTTQETETPSIQSSETGSPTKELQSANILNQQNNKSRRPKWLKIIIVIPLIIVLVVFGFIGYFVVDTSLYCSHKTHTANNQAKQQESELSNIVLFNSKPQITTSTDYDCVDGDGTGSALATYNVKNLNLTQANDKVIASIRGKEKAITFYNNGDAHSSEFDQNNSNYIINELMTSITSPKGKLYDVQFRLANSYTCTPTCDSGDIVQEYNLQTTPINNVYVEVN